MLDTHVLVWAVSNPERLSAKAHAAILDPGNDLFASHVSLWELALKAQTHAPSLPPLDNIERDFAQAGVSAWVPIKPVHIFGITDLPLIHRDPFDRLLIAQAQHEGLTLVTRDALIPQYAIRTLW